MAITTVGIVGAGIMGSGIAQAASQKGGYKVVMYDVDGSMLEKGLEGIKKRTSRLVEKGTLNSADAEAVVARILTVKDAEQLADADLVIEAASENVEIKKSIFKQLDAVCGGKTVLASNTSSISITRIGSFTTRPDRVVGLHFFNPAPVMELVELIRGIRSSPQALALAEEAVKAMGKTIVPVKDSAGFVVNRILLPMINEAVYLLQEGVPDAASIDAAMKLGANHPMGPLALADLIGLDT
jgi:3-hydroxybutyryl-CoA dehydrogenase